MTNRRIVNAAYFVTSVTVFAVLFQLANQIWESQQLPDYKLVGALGLPMILSVFITGIGLVVATRHPKATPFLVEVVAELREVTWPTRSETISHTKVVILTSLVLSLLIWAYDTVWAVLTKLLLTPNA